MPAKYCLIACDVLLRELCLCVAQSKQLVDIVFLPKGLHDMGQARMSGRLQEAIDKIDFCKYDAILLGYALCNNGIVGLRAPRPLVIPRGHDCITLLLGSRERYEKYFNENPGTYFKSPGWIERGELRGEENRESMMTQFGMNKSYREYVDQYGEENAKYFMEVFGDTLVNYTKIAFVNTHVGDCAYYRAIAKDEAARRDWGYEELDGSTDLLMKLVDGDWDEKDFLIVPPGRTIAASYTNDIICPRA